jgi:hypothetical protein
MSITTFSSRDPADEERQEAERRRAWSLLASLALARGDTAKATRFEAKARGEADAPRASARVPRGEVEHPLPAASGERN